MYCSFLHLYVGRDCEREFSQTKCTSSNSMIEEILQEGFNNLLASYPQLSVHILSCVNLLSHLTEFLSLLTIINKFEASAINITIITNAGGGEDL